jgi:hypothetical protein
MRLQQTVIGDARFVRLGLRREGGFVGEHDRETGMPIPNHISASPEDLVSLIEGPGAFDSDAVSGLDAVIAAAVLAFGFGFSGRIAAVFPARKRWRASRISELPEP